jgi:hypothetical protein
MMDVYFEPMVGRGFGVVGGRGTNGLTRHCILLKPAPIARPNNYLHRPRRTRTGFADNSQISQHPGSLHTGVNGAHTIPATLRTKLRDRVVMVAALLYLRFSDSAMLDEGAGLQLCYCLA